MPLTLSTRSYAQYNPRPKSQLNADLRWLIDAIVAEDPRAEIYFNHADDRDPTLAWNKVGLVTKMRVYYQPAGSNELEYFKHATGNYLSGRRRLVTRTDSDGTAFFTTNHPERGANGLTNNNYGAAA